MRFLYQASGGLLGHRLLTWQFLLLTTTGRKSGQPRTHTLFYLPDGQNLAIVASNNGEDTPPAWYLNLSAQPHVRAQVGRRQGEYLARTATPEERAALWPRLIAAHPPYRRHQQRTSREIPVVLLAPRNNKETDVHS